MGESKAQSEIGNGWDTPARKFSSSFVALNFLCYKKSPKEWRVIVSYRMQHEGIETDGLVVCCWGKLKEQVKFTDTKEYVLFLTTKPMLHLQRRKEVSEQKTFILASYFLLLVIIIDAYFIMQML
jgi:hypothetical protein